MKINLKSCVVLRRSIERSMAMILVILWQQALYNKSIFYENYFILIAEAAGLMATF